MSVPRTKGDAPGLTRGAPSLLSVVGLPLGLPLAENEGDGADRLVGVFEDVTGPALVDPSVEPMEGFMGDRLAADRRPDPDLLPARCYDEVFVRRHPIRGCLQRRYRHENGAADDGSQDPGHAYLPSGGRHMILDHGPKCEPLGCAHTAPCRLPLAPRGSLPSRASLLGNQRAA